MAACPEGKKPSCAPPAMRGGPGRPIQVLSGTTSAGTAAIARAAASGGSHQRGARARRPRRAAYASARTSTGSATAASPRSAKNCAAGEGRELSASQWPNRSSSERTGPSVAACQDSRARSSAHSGGISGESGTSAAYGVGERGAAPEQGGD
ncbi:hypothetical protein ADK38_04885, partial [Streptomyces varsoviensis]